MRNFLLLAFCLIAVSAMADEGAEKHAQSLFAALRCQVCAGESIGSSDAELAQDIRRIVRARIDRGESDEAIERYLVGRYGESILLDPPFVWRTVFLWLAPFGLLTAGCGLLFRRRRAA